MTHYTRQMEGAKPYGACQVGKSSQAVGSKPRPQVKEITMQIGMIGLGRMGANMVRRLIRKGHSCVVFNRSPQAVNELVKERAIGATSLADLVKRLEKPRAIW